MSNCISLFCRTAVASFLAGVSCSVVAVVRTVGSDGNCSHASVAAALASIPASGTHEVRIALPLANDQALQVTTRVITLRGGYASCSAASSTGSSTLSGQGGVQDSVLTILGSSNDVILENINLIRGDEVYDGYGGGLDFRGAGVVTLRNVGISQNYAGYGGGISVSAQAGNAELRIEAGTVIQLNTAQFSGGGIRIEGDTYLSMIGDNSAILLNEALGFNPITNQPQYGFGGGVQVLAPAQADIGSPGIGNGVIVSNSARYGGGIAINATDTDIDSTLNLYTTDPSRPTRIFGNRATNNGGGVYADVLFSLANLSVSTFCAKDARIDGNIAQEGSAIYLDSDSSLSIASGARAFLNDLCSSRPGQVPCGEGDSCSTIIGNRAETAAGQATAGSTLLAQDSASLFVRNTDASGNTGGYTMRSFGDSNIKIENSLIGSNINTVETIRIENGDGEIAIRDSTIAGNSIGADHVLAVAGDLVLARSILWQPGKTSLTSGGGLSVESTLASEAVSLGGPPDAFVAFPRFIDLEGNDYRLRAASPAIDYVLQVAENQRDLDLALRNKRLQPVPRATGLVRDLGAYERQSLQPLVLNPDFNSGSGLWQLTTPGVSTWDTTENVVGSSGSGSIKVNLAGTAQQQRTYGLTQCVHLPGPGIYALNGWGRSAAGATGNRDYLYLNWEYRQSGGEGCTSGSADAAGDHFLSNSATWRNPANPALIAVPEDQWTSTSSIAFTMVVVEVGITSPSTTTGWFDGITLGVLVDDTIFEDGFDLN